MAIFTLTDITFNPAKQATGPLSPLVAGNSAYNYNMYRYPIDLGGSDRAHYMVIHINQQAKTQFSGTLSGDKPTVVSDRLASGSAGAAAFGGSVQQVTNVVGGVLQQAVNTVATNSTLNSIVNKLPASVQAGLDIAGGVAQSSFDFIAKTANQINGTNFVRTIQRTTDTISLYMPDTLNFVYTQNYDTPSIGQTPIAAALSAGASVMDSMKGKNVSPKELGKALGKNLSPFIASLVANQTDIGKVLFAAGTGVVQNPMLEILYSSPKFREFRFDFMFYPRSEKEAAEVQNIIERLRFHQAPEVVQNSGGFFLVPPSEFDIKFYYNGKENPNIPKISTCVMESMDVDYAPNGFSAYEVPGERAGLGRTGMPVAIRMSLQFKETEIVTKSTFKTAVATDSLIKEVASLGGGSVYDPKSDFNTGANGWGNYGE